MTEPAPPEPTEWWQRLGLGLVACVIGPPVGFFGPIVALELISRFVEHSEGRFDVVALGLPFAVGLALLVPPSTRVWGVAWLFGVTVGEAALVVVLMALAS